MSNAGAGPLVRASVRATVAELPPSTAARSQEATSLFRAMSRARRKAFASAEIHPRQTGNLAIGPTAARQPGGKKGTSYPRGTFCRGQRDQVLISRLRERRLGIDEVFWAIFSGLKEPTRFLRQTPRFNSVFLLPVERLTPSTRSASPATGAATSLTWCTTGSGCARHDL